MRSLLLPVPSSLAVATVVSPAAVAAADEVAASPATRPTPREDFPARLPDRLSELTPPTPGATDDAPGGARATLGATGAIAPGDFLPADGLPQERVPRIAVAVPNAQDASYVVQPDTGWNGVVGLGRLGNLSCTATLLPSGRQVLTAAHCFNSGPGVANLNPDASQYRVYFDLATGRTSANLSRVVVNSAWRADFDSNNDIAIAELAETAPETADRYEIYRGSDEVGQVAEFVGYGKAGTGNSGEVRSDVTTIKRRGKNRYDALGDVVANDPGSRIQLGTQLLYDFDNGRAENDALGQDYGRVDLGLGEREIGSSSGDSGGPGFLNGQIAGLVSYGFSPRSPGTDVTAGNDTSFGEIFASTRVSAFASWVDATLAEMLSGPDRLQGTERDDRLFGNRGEDTLFGLGGNDQLQGGRDNDVMEGNAGNDVLFGNWGADRLGGNAGNDSLFGGREDDTLIGAEGEDWLAGEFGRDVLLGGSGDDRFLLDPRTSGGDPSQADLIADWDRGDAIGLLGGLNEGQVILEAGQLARPEGLLAGSWVRTRDGGLLLGFVQNVSPAQLVGRLFPAG